MICSHIDKEFTSNEHMHTIYMETHKILLYMELHDLKLFVHTCLKISEEKEHAYLPIR